MSGDFVIGGQQSLPQWPSSSFPSPIASARSPKCGAKCQKCDKQGSVGLDKESGLPYLTMTLYVLPRCGHSVCVGCKTQWSQEKFCRICHPYDALSYRENETANLMEPIANIVTCGFSVMGKTGFEEIQASSIGGTRLIKKPTRPRKAQNAMFALGNSPFGKNVAEISCAVCYSANAVVVCDHCFVLCCEKCFKENHAESNQTHQAIGIIPMDTKLDACTEHRTVSADCFCSTCDIYLCVDCLFQSNKTGKHTGHNLLRNGCNIPDPNLVLESARRFQNDLKNSEVQSEQLASKIESLAEMKIKHLNMRYMQIMGLLQLSLKKQFVDVKEFCHQKLSEVRKCQESSNIISNYVSELLKCIEQKTQDRESVTLELKKLNAIVSLPSCFISNYEALDSFELMFQIDETDIEEIVENFGKVSFMNKEPIIALYDYEYRRFRKSNGKDELCLTKLVTERNKRPDVRNMDGFCIDSIALSQFPNIAWPRMLAFGYIVKITHLKTPVDFYFIISDSESDLDKLNHRIQSLVADQQSNIANLRTLSKLQVDSMVLAKFFDNNWYRAKVLQQVGVSSRFPDSVLVSFVDYGNKAYCSNSEIKVPSTQYLLHTTPPFAMHGGLLNLAPKHDLLQGATLMRDRNRRWTEDSLLYFKSLVAGRTLVATNCTTTEYGKSWMDLYEMSGSVDNVKLYSDSPASICHSMVFRKHAKFIDKQNAQKTNIMRPKYPFYLRSEILFASEQFSDKVIVTEFINPSHFYCRLADPVRNEQQKALLSGIEDFVEKLGDREECKILCPYEGMYCLAPFEIDDSCGFYRAIVVEVNHFGEIKVFFVDFGNSVVVTVDKLRKIPMELLEKYPSVVFLCSLHGVKPLDNRPMWGRSAMEGTKKLLLSRIAKLKVVSIDQNTNKYNVQLIVLFRKGSEPELVADILTRQKLVAKEIERTGSLDSLFDQENEKNEPEAESFGASLTVDDIQKAPADPAKLKLNLPSLEMRKVHMTNLEDPWNFYFRVLDIGGNDPITDVEFELQVATSEGILTRFDSLEEIISSESTALVALVLLDDDEDRKLVRCLLVKFQGEKIEVFLIDYGLRRLVERENLLMYNCDRISIGLACKCELSLISPAGSSSGKWSNNSKEAMQRLFSENDIFVDLSLKRDRPMVSAFKYWDHVDFSEVYHIGPAATNKSEHSRLKSDFVPVSYFLKINGLAITNRNPGGMLVANGKDEQISLEKDNVLSLPECQKPVVKSRSLALGRLEKKLNEHRMREKTINDACNFKARRIAPNHNKENRSDSDVLEKRDDIDGPCNNMEAYFSEDCANNGKCWEQKSSENMSSCGQSVSSSGKDLSGFETDDEKSESAEQFEHADYKDCDEDDDEEEAAPTVLFVTKPTISRRANTSKQPESQRNSKTEPSDPDIAGTSKQSTVSAGSDNNNNAITDGDATSMSVAAFLNNLEKEAGIMKKESVNTTPLAVEKATSSSSVSRTIEFVQPDLFSPSPDKAIPRKMETVDGFEQVPLWDPMQLVAQDLQDNGLENPNFDLTLHGIRDIQIMDEVGDVSTHVVIKPNCSYKALEVPKVLMYEIQFEAFAPDGVTLFGVLKDFNDSLKQRINTEVDKFINGRYVGGGFCAPDLYENMAACAYYEEEKKWFRAIFLNTEGDKFKVKFADFGNNRNVKRNEMLPLGAFTDVPALFSTFSLLGVKFADDFDANLNKLYIKKMLDTVLNDKDKVYVGIRGCMQESGRDKMLATVYSARVYDLRHFMALTGYQKWDITIPPEVKLESEKADYVNAIKSTIPFHVTRYEKLVGETVQMEVLSESCENFMFAKFRCNMETDKFKRFALNLSRSVPDECWQVSDNETSIGQLVFYYSREIQELCVYHRAQVMRLQSENPRQFSVFLIDHGYSVNVPPSLALRKVSDLDRFMGSPADAVPVLLLRQNANSNRVFKSGEIVTGKIVNVREVVTLEI